MGGFNKIKENKPTARSYEGGAVYEKSPIDEWMNMLFSSFLERGFYESAETQQKRFIELTDKVADAYGYPFVAKCAVFARNKLGMRSISQLTAAWLNDKTFENKRAFYRAFCHRPDDIAELFAAIDFLGGHRSHAVVRGCGDYLSKLSSYSLGKYKLASRNYNMFDLINITHATSFAINEYKQGLLSTPDTWEVKISTAKSENERNEEWIRLVEEGKLGYMALIRNLNNILEAGVTERWVRKYLVPQLTSEVAIFGSMIFPYRIYTAYKNLKIKNLLVITALSNAFKIAVANTPEFKGNTAVILDVSGSMDQHISAKSNITIKEAGACFAVSLFLSNPFTTIVKFGSYAKEVHNLNPLESVFTLIEKLCDNEWCGYSTNLTPAVEILGGKNIQYDRVFLISDMQVFDGIRWYGDPAAVKAYHTYLGNTTCYSFDLGNYHTQTLSNYDHIRYVTTLSDQVFKFIDLLESGKDLVSYINSVVYY